MTVTPTSPAPRPLYALDTHALYWHLTGSKPLPPRVRDLFREAHAGTVKLVVPHIVLAELFYILGKFGQEASFVPFMARLQSSPAYQIESLTVEDLLELPNFTEIPEMHDRLIAIQARRLGATLATRDPALQASSNVRWIW